MNEVSRAERERQLWEEEFPRIFGVTREEFAEDVKLILLSEFGEDDEDDGQQQRAEVGSK